MALKAEIGSIIDIGEEHLRVVRTFANLVVGAEAIGELLGLDNYHGQRNVLKKNDYKAIRRFRRGKFRIYQGIIYVNAQNRPTSLVKSIKKVSNLRLQLIKSLQIIRSKQIKLA